MATLQIRLQDLVTRIATEIKANAAKVGDVATLTTTAKIIVPALNELKALIDQVSSASGATINDGSNASLTQTYSITKILDLINTAIGALTAGAPTALNTLDELAAALGDDGNFAATITTGLGNRVRTDTAAQGLTSQQKLNARTNIDALGTTELGNPDANLVTVFETGLS